MNKEIKNFIEKQKSPQKEICLKLKKIVLEIKPDAKEEIKYNGLCFFVDAKLICGIFVRKNHISVEFSFGARMLDPDNFLEGIGKYRKHLKIFNKKDIKDKKVSYYVKQSFKL
jgi:hypothetical protein